MNTDKQILDFVRRTNKDMTDNQLRKELKDNELHRRIIEILSRNFSA